MIVKLSSSLNNSIFLNYRMPTNETGKRNPILEFYLPPRALLCEVDFPTMQHYEEFKKQNIGLFDKGVLFENEKIKEKELKAKQDENNNRLLNKVKSEISKGINKLQATAEESNIKLTNTIEKTTIKKAK